MGSIFEVKCLAAVRWQERQRQIFIIKAIHLVSDMIGCLQTYHKNYSK